MSDKTKAGIVALIAFVMVAIIIGTGWYVSTNDERQEVVKLESQSAQGWSDEDYFAAILYSILGIGVIVGIFYAATPTKVWFKREFKKESTWQGIIAVIFACIIIFVINVGIKGCKDSWEEFEAEERREAMEIIDSATDEEKKEARESLRRSREYEREQELEDAIERYGH